MNELHLFAGAGGGILGGELLGHRTVCAVEIEEYPRKVLLQRQRDGILPWFPIWDDITTFDGRPWKGRIDIVSGGFPCQDISAAGKGAGIEGERSGLWGEIARVVNEIRPQFVFVENSPMLTSRGLGRVLGDLAEMGYNARWCVLGADDVGAPHRRKRIWILAYADSERLEVSTQGQFKSTQEKKREPERCKSCRGNTKTKWWNRAAPKPGLCRVAHGVANRVDRLKAIGNGQVPAVAAIAFTILSEGLIKKSP